MLVNVGELRGGGAVRLARTFLRLADECLLRLQLTRTVAGTEVANVRFRPIADISAGATFDQVETRLTTLLRRNKRKGRVAGALKGWASVGVVPSALEPRRQEELLKAFRAEDGVPRSVKAPVEETLRDFATKIEIAIVIGYRVDEEPALLVPATSVARLHGKLSTLYPDGLLIADQAFSRVLVFDFGEGQDVDTEEVTLPRS